MTFEQWAASDLAWKAEVLRTLKLLARTLGINPAAAVERRSESRARAAAQVGGFAAAQQRRRNRKAG